MTQHWIDTYNKNKKRRKQETKDCQDQIKNLKKRIEVLDKAKYTYNKHKEKQCDHKQPDGSSALEFISMFGHRCKICTFNEY